MHIAVRTDLLALTKNTNTLVTDKMYDTTGRKKTVFILITQTVTAT